MIHVTTDDLRNIIALKVNETILEYRQSKGNGGSDSYPMATNYEIDEFIKSIPYYDDQLKNFLLGEYSSCAALVSEIWFGRFYSAITWWYESEEWMDYNHEAFADALLNYKDESIIKLSSPPYTI